MPRTEARVLPGIWRDEGFRQLSGRARLLYMMLLTSPELSAAGTIPFLPKRWSLFCGLSPSDTEWAADELGEDGWIIRDEQEQEAFVSGFFAHEKIARQPRRAIAAVDAMRTLSSLRVAGFASEELAELTAAAPVPVPRGVRAAVLERDGYKCRKCRWAPGDPVPENGNGRGVYRTLEIDHIYPKSLGGASEEANYQVLCTTCNSKKGARILWPAASGASS